MSTPQPNQWTGPELSDHLIIENDGALIRQTNYWDSPMARNGKVFLTWNAKTGRLLLPDSQLNCLGEIRTASSVIVTRGPWPEVGKAEALEILFEDGSNSPFCFHIGSEQTDRLPPKSEHGRDISFTVWSRSALEVSLPAKFRMAPRIPCLDPWE